jgi:hypothetical protein
MFLDSRVLRVFVVSSSDGSSWSSSDGKEVAGSDAVFFFVVTFLDTVLLDAVFLEVVFFAVSLEVVFFVVLPSDDKDKLVSSSSEGMGIVFFLVAAFFFLARFVFLEVVFFVDSSSDDNDKHVSSSSEGLGAAFFLAAAFFLVARFVFVDLFNVSRLRLISASLFSSFTLFNVSSNFFLVFEFSLVSCSSLRFKSFC